MQTMSTQGYSTNKESGLHLCPFSFHFNPFSILFRNFYKTGVLITESGLTETASGYAILSFMDRPHPKLLRQAAVRLAGILTAFLLSPGLSGEIGDASISRPAAGSDGIVRAAVRTADGTWGILAAGPASGRTEFMPLRLGGRYEEMGLFADNRDRLWLAATELQGETEIIRLGRLENNSFAEARTIGIPGGWNGQADLHFPGDGEPWIAWRRQAPDSEEIRVEDTSSGLSWRITKDGTSALSAPRLCPDGRGGLWILWTGRSGKSYVVAGRRFDGRAWSEEILLADNGERPSLRLDAALGEDGILRAAWSAYDGRNYRIRTIECRGGLWSKSRNLTDHAGMELNPRVFRSDRGAAVVWASSESSGTRLLAVFMEGARTDGPFLLSEGAASPLFEAAAAGRGIFLFDDRGTRPGCVFVERDRLRENRPDRETKARAAGPLRGRRRPAALNQNISRDENEYIGFGDSITFGYIDQQEAPDRGYIPRLDARLDGVFGPTDVVNEGRPGALTTGGLNRIDEVLAARRGRYIFVMFGTNDVKILDNPIEVAVFNLREICRRSLAAGVMPILSTVIPRRDWTWYYPNYRNRHLALNAGIRAMIPELIIPYVDMEAAFDAATGDAADLLSDGVHPNEAGYIVMTGVWYDRVRALPFPPLGLQARIKGGATESSALLKPFCLQNENGYGSVSSAGKLGILLAWEANPKTADAASIEGYRVYRRFQGESPERFACIGSVGAIFAFLDRNVEAGAHVDYAVAAVGTGGVEGSRSEIMSNYSFRRNM